jgi:hypothetical protein
MKTDRFNLKLNIKMENKTGNQFYFLLMVFLRLNNYTRMGKLVEDKLDTVMELFKMNNNIKMEKLKENKFISTKTEKFRIYFHLKMANMKESNFFIYQMD